ncbi:MAG: tetratricopeptide repeat protein [Myxococcales bacterium]|nr:tetratricopeptide repeat protein [Myxococcales bacterium]
MTRTLARLALLTVATLVGCGGRAHPAAPRPPDSTQASSERSPDSDLAAATPIKAAVGDPSARPGTGAGKVYDLEEIKLVVSRDPGGDETIDAVAPSTLLDEGRAALAAGRPVEAIAVFRRLAAEFPASRLAPSALYYVGVVYEGLGDTTSAITSYRDVVTHFPTGRESLDAHLRIAGLQAERQDWRGADGTLGEILLRADLGHADRLEAQARRGYVLMEQGQAPEAEASLKAAIATWNRAIRIDDRYYIAMAHYYLAELRHRAFAAVKLRTALDELKADLVQKEALAAAAYDQWREALELQDPYWALASGYQMSQIFFELWQTAVTSPYPDGLDPAARTYYTTEVHDRVRRHLTTAFDGHQMNVRLAGAYGVSNAWSEASKTRSIQVATILAREARGEMSAVVPPAP